MFRSILLFAALVFVIGCKKGRDAKPAEPDSPNAVASKMGNAKTGTPNPKPETPKSGGEPRAAEVPKLQPRAKFKLPADLGSRFDLRSPMACSADGRTLAVALKTSQICIYDITGEPKLLGQYSGMRFALSPSGKFLFTGGNFFDCRVYDLATKKQIVKASNKTAFDDSCVYFRDDNTIVHALRSDFPTKPAKGKITLWDVTNDTQSSFEIADNRFDYSFPMFGGKELWLVTSISYRNKFEIECYDVTEKKLVRTIKALTESGVPYSEYASYISVTPNGSLFASSGYKAPIFDGASGKVVAKMPSTVAADKTGLLPPDGRFYLSRGGVIGNPYEYKDFLLYDWKAQRVVAVLTGQSATDTEALGTPDGRTLVSVSGNGEAVLYDLSSVK